MSVEIDSKVLTGRKRYRPYKPFMSRKTVLILQVEETVEGRSIHDMDPSDLGLEFKHTNFRDAKVEDLGNLLNESTHV